MTLYLRAYLLALIVFFLLPTSALAATLGLTPLNTSIGIGAIVTETVVVTSADQAMNAISGTLSFSEDLLQVVSISKTNSVLSLWVQDPTYSNNDGTISFSGVVPNPGYIGSRRQVLLIQFRAKKEGTAAVTFSSSSEVLANDGNGTNILTGTQSSTINISASQPQSEPPPPSVSSPVSGVGLLAHITSSTHPNETQWYKLAHAVFDWTNAQGVTSVRLGYDKNEEGKPSVLYSDPISHKELQLDGGIWYFHVQERDPSGWGPISTYRIQIDTASPLPFTVLFPQGTTTPSGNSISALFAATDELSGIDHYQVAVDGKEFTVTADEGSKPYAISADPGAHMLLVRAYDKAGNFSLANGRFFITEGTAQPEPFDFFAFGWLTVNYISLIFIVLAILGTLLFAAWYIHVHFSAYRRRLNHQLSITETHIHKKFDNLKDAITEEVLKLERVKSARELTREEEKIIARFKKLLDQSEQEIEKDIKDIPR